MCEIEDASFNFYDILPIVNMTCKASFKLPSDKKLFLFE